MPTIIALTGYAGSGKDATADMLGYARVSFAQPLRELLYAIDPYIKVRAILPWRRIRRLSALGDYAAAKKYPEVRRLLQELGQGVRAVLGDDALVKVAERELCKLLAANRDIVVTDLRFPNELESLRFVSGIFPGTQLHVVRVVRLDVGPVNSHISETAIDSLLADYTLRNDGTLTGLAVSVVAMRDFLAQKSVSVRKNP